MHSLLLSITKYSYCEIFIALGLGIVGLPIPDEMLMAYAGFLVFQGKLNFLLVLISIIAVLMGIYWKTLQVKRNNDTKQLQ